MKDKFIFNVCAFLGMFVTMISIISFLKHFGIHVSPKKMVMMVGIIASFAWFADVFFRIAFYLLLSEALGGPWKRQQDRENLSFFANEDLKEFHWGEVLTVLIVTTIGYYLMNVIISPYSSKFGVGLNVVALSFFALWLGGLIIGGILYVVFKSCSDSHES